MIGVAAAMGFSPQQFDAMSMFEFRAARTGWAAANGAGETKPASLSDAEDEALRRRYAEW